MVKILIQATPKPLFEKGARIGGEKMYKKQINKKFGKNKKFGRFLRILRIANFALQKEIRGYYKFAENFSKVQAKLLVTSQRRLVQQYAKDLLAIFFSNIRVKGFRKVKNTLYFNNIPVLTVNKTNVSVTVIWRQKYLIVTEVFG